MANSISFQIFGQDVSASKALEGIANHAGSVGSKIGSSFSKLSGAIGGEFGEVVSTITEGFDNLGEHASKGAKIMAGGAALTGIGAALQQLGSGEQQAQQQLQQAVEDSGKSWEEFEGQIDDAVHAQENFGHSSQDTQAALQKMTEATGDPAKALKNLGLVSNLAADQHISLADAADKVDKIMGGKGGKTLAQYGIVMGKGKDATKNAEGALDSLSKKLEGQAAAANDTFAGKISDIRAKMGDWAAQMAGSLGPAITALGPVMAVAGAAMELLSARKAAVAAATAVEVAATEGETVATEAATVASDGFNLSLLANPIVLIVVLIVALIAAIVLAYQHFTTFRNIVNGAWAGIKAAVSAVVGWFMSYVWPMLRVYINFIVAYFKVLWAGIKIAWDGIKGAISLVVGWFENTAWPKIKAVGALIAGIWTTVMSAAKVAFNAIASLWNNTVGALSFTVPSWVPIIGGDGFSMPKIPLMAQGGIVNRATLAMIGEAGPEAVIPLSRMGNMGGDVIHLHMTNGFIGSEQQLSAALVSLLQRAKGRGVKLNFG